ncbi:MAG: Zn(2+)-responsive transcriptional regulator [Pseudomonadales bacterium]|nr:Zn(2+)-responsive transcriptional regulator [Pseudomonadales bacterium]
MQIGELAKRCSVSIDTVRYYEKQGLLKPEGRTPAGYRYYAGESLKCLQFILKAKSLGFTLREIQDLLQIRVSPEDYECAKVKQMAEDKLTNIEQKIAELKQIQAALKDVAESCYGGTEPATSCSIIDALSNHSENQAAVKE